ncbi:hypothetical protein E4U53_003481 [Claviceps sorghi]|nr:hypothetical protein E4U53_003481 [Claviceps sorghi]
MTLCGQEDFRWLKGGEEGVRRDKYLRSQQLNVAEFSLMHETQWDHDNGKCIQPTIQTSGTEQGLNGCGHRLGGDTAGAMIRVDTPVSAFGGVHPTPLIVGSDTS